MICYKENGSEVEYILSKENMINNGTQGCIYRYNADKCIKIYNDNAMKYDNRFNPEIFNIFRNLSLPGIYKLYELLYSDPSLNNVIGYMMKYYEKSSENILYMPINYTVNNLNMLIKSIEILTNEGLLLKDLYYSNVVVGESRIILIDRDTSIKSNMDRDELLELNIHNLLYAFKGLWIDGFRKIGIDVSDNILLNDKIDSLFNYSKNPVKKLSLMTVGAQRPIDLFYYR